MGDIVILAYRPKSGHEAELADLVASHVPDLRAWGLATDMPATTMRARDGTIVEVFEWHAGATAKAHADPRVLTIWGKFGAACDIVGLRDVAETADLFATFAPV